MQKPRIEKIYLENLAPDENDFNRYALGPVSPTPFAPNPLPEVLLQKDCLIPITAHSRLRGAKQEGLSNILAVVHSAISPSKAIELCARDITWAAPLSHADRITAVKKLADFSKDYSPEPNLAKALGIEPTKGAFEPLEKVWNLGKEVLDKIRGEALSFNCALAVCDAPKSEQEPFIDIFTNLISPNRNTAKRMVDNAVSVALNQNIKVSELFESEQISFILFSKSSGPEKIKALDQALIKLRYPVLFAEIRKGEKAIFDLALPKDITITLPQNLESGRLSLLLKPGSSKDLTRQLSLLKRAIENGDFEKIFEVIK